MSTLKVIMEMKTKVETAQNFLISFRILNMNDFKECLGATRRKIKIMTLSCE